MSSRIFGFLYSYTDYSIWHVLVCDLVSMNFIVLYCMDPRLQSYYSVTLDHVIIRILIKVSETTLFASGIYTKKLIALMLIYLHVRFM
jgi:hypothetical protein